MSKLFTPLKSGRLELGHRVAMAPLTRYRADDHQVQQIVKEYYTQRASTPGTLLITEATQISPGAGGSYHGPGIWTGDQISAWRMVTDAVHAKGCKMFCQLWHLGRAGRPEVLASYGRKLKSSSPIAIDSTREVPEEMIEEEIWDTISDYATAARNAIKAGFDGVEIHGANGYLPDQFLQDVCNQRTDIWGVSIENRARFHLEVAKAVVAAVGAERTAMRLSPYSEYLGMRMADPMPQFEYLVRELRTLGLAYLHLVEGRISGHSDTDVREGNTNAPLVRIWNNASPVLLAGGFTPASAVQTVDQIYKDFDVVIVFGRHFLANPDLVFRLQNSIALNKYDRPTFYTPLVSEGYIDYPFCQEFTISKAELYTLTASQVLRRLKEGTLTVEEYVRSLLARIEQRDPAVKAWAFLDANQVLSQARELDKVSIDQRGPLHGVAVGVKDVIHTKDMPTQHNSPIYQGHSPAVDAGCVAILRQAGALILGKTTTSEFAATIQGPKTQNPHDPLRTPGGSSSGSGAAVGDFQVPMALGTQTGGSTIRPGSFNGIYAFKPTWGAVTREGLKIYSLMLDTLGLYARSVEDLELLADVLALHDDDNDDNDTRKEQQKAEGVNGMKFALLKNPQDVFPEPGPGSKAAMSKAVVLLVENGAVVEEVDMGCPEFKSLPDWHRCMMATDGQASFLPEYRTHKDKLSDFLVGHVENDGGYTRKARLETLDGTAALRPKVDAVLAGYDALLTPSVPDEAPLGIGSTGSAAFNSIWTALHVPVVNIPGFQGENGLPIGVSLVAPRYRDRHLLRVSGEVGKIFEAQGGWRREVIS